MPAVDLNAYCTRIGYSGPLVPTLATLRGLHERHIASIPFEAIDALLDREIGISPAAVDAKLIGARRGGYCFEQNALFKRVLQAIGFEVEGLIARVWWMMPPEFPPQPRTHMALRVTIDGTPWLADIGFGGLVPPAPLRMDVHDPQPTVHEPYRLAPVGRGLMLTARLGDEWQRLYELDLAPQLDVDYEPANWFTSKHPGSVFRHRLMVALATPEARYSLLDQRLTIRRPGQSPEQHILDADGIEGTLAETFGLPVAPEWRPVCEQAAGASTS